MVPEKAPRPASWRPAAALIITALVIFTLAALITAIVTQHAQPVPFQRVDSVRVPYQQVIVPPGAPQQAVLAPYVIPVPNIPMPDGPPPGP